MNHERHFLYLEDECPTIGAGWRIVLARIGYKWVHLKAPNAERGTRIKRKLWNELKQRTYRYESQPNP